MLRGDGSGAFPARAGEFAVFSRPQGAPAADFNHDGLMDVAVASTNGTALNILYGSASGTFTRKTIDAGRTLNVLALADVERRRLDGHCRGRHVAERRRDVSWQRGPIHARRHAREWGDLPAAAGARGIVSADFDNDGRVDIAAGSEFAAPLSLFENSTAFVPPAFSFTKRSLPNAGWFPATPAIADFNENGIPDFVADRSVVLDGVTVLNVETHPGQMRDVAAADINGDGHADAIFVMYNFDRVFNSIFE